jgi:exopolysaccharide biosynthesis polyprenyl glycosylphosphotransferase
MTRRHLMTLRFLLVLVDLVTSALVFLTVSLVRFEADPAAQWSVGIDVGTASILFGVTWVGVFWVLGLYRLRARWGLMAEARDIARGTVAAAAVTFALLFLLHQDNVSRLFLALLFVVQPIVMLAGRALLRHWFEARRRSGRDTNFMLVVGTGPGAQAFADHVERHPALGMRVIGHLAVVDETDSANPNLTRPVLGDWSEISDVFRTTIVDEVAVCLPPEAARYLEPIVAIAADEGKTVRVPRAAAEGVLIGALREEFDGYLVHSVVHDGQRELELGLKRAIDVVGSLLALIVLIPVFAVAAAAIRFADGAPVLFRQHRIGRHGRSFTVIKFRTMHVGAEERIDELAALNEVKGPAFKMRDDPRVSRLGRFLRRASIDELPQFVNVLRGEMSLVGPRPALPREVASYDIWHRRRLSVRPGMTGLWQVEARMEADFDGRAQLDLRYIDQWSLWMDLRIMLRTLPAVFLRSGQ